MTTEVVPSWDTTSYMYARNSFLQPKGTIVLLIIYMKFDYNLAFMPRSLHFSSMVFRNTDEDY